MGGQEREDKGSHLWHTLPHCCLHQDSLAALASKPAFHHPRGARLQAPHAVTQRASMTILTILATV